MEGKNNDAVTLLNTFPEEIWLKILNEVKEMQDYQNIRTAAALFHDILLPREPEIVFIEALKIMMKNLPHDWWSTNADGSEMEDDEEPSVPVRTLREVCRASRYAMDHCLQSQDFYSKEVFIAAEPNIHSRTFTRRILDIFWRIEHIVAFEEHFGPTHEAGRFNPFLSRGILLRFDLQADDQDHEEFLSACIRLLNKFGKQVWYCVIMNHAESPEFYSQTVPTLLEKMSNLRAIMIKGNVTNDQQVENAVEGVPFPMLKHLNMVTAWGIPPPTLRALLIKNPEVLNVGTRYSSQLTKCCLELLPGVTDAVFVVERQGNMDSLGVLEGALVVAPLKHLRLRVNDLQGVSWGRILEFVETRFAGTLTSLYIHLPPLAGQPQAIRELRFPHLKTLIMVVHDPVSLDFMLPNKDTLEKIFINAENGLPDGATEDVFTVLGQPLKSAARAHFPRLKELKLQTVPGEIIYEYVTTRDPGETGTQRTGFLGRVRHAVECYIM